MTNEVGSSAGADMRSYDRRWSRRAKALGLDDRPRLALFVGLIRPYKGVDVLVEAIARLPADSDWELVVAGDAIALGEGERQVQALADAAGQNDRSRLATVGALAYRDAKGDVAVTRRTSYIQQLDDLPTPAWDLVRFAECLLRA